MALRWNDAPLKACKNINLNQLFTTFLRAPSCQLTLKAPRNSTVARIARDFSVTDDDQKQRLAQLEARIEAAKKADEPKSHTEEHYSMANLAWRMVIELVAGLGIGFGIGYGLDHLFGTLPLFMVLFVLLGLAAGVKTMLRSAQEIQEKKLADEAEKNAQDRD